MSNDKYLRTIVRFMYELILLSSEIDFDYGMLYGHSQVANNADGSSVNSATVSLTRFVLPPKVISIHRSDGRAFRHLWLLNPHQQFYVNEACSWEQTVNLFQSVFLACHASRTVC